MPERRANLAQTYTLNTLNQFQQHQQTTVKILPIRELGVHYQAPDDCLKQRSNFSKNQPPFHQQNNLQKIYQ